MSRQLNQALDEVARRFRQERLWGSLALCWLAWAVLAWGSGLANNQFETLPVPIGWLLVSVVVAVLATAVFCVLWSVRSARDPRWVAQRIEAKHPELKTGLLAAVEEIAKAPSGRLGYLQSAVIREALDHRRAHDWDETVPSWTLRGAKLAHVAALASLLVVLGTLTMSARSQAGGVWSFASVNGTGSVQVEPGNTEIERGTSLLVVAKFSGSVPGESWLAVDSQGRGASRRAMTRSLEDPTFAGRVESVDSDLDYRVEFEGNTPETYHVKVFEYPELERADARLVFPRFAALEPKTVEDIRHVTAVEGTELTLLCRLNKEVATARLVDAEGQAIELTPAEQVGHVYRAALTLSDSKRFGVKLVDREGRANKLNAEIIVNVTRNRPPVVKMTQPGHDVRVSPVEELALKADLEDDFGLTRHGLSFSMAGQPEQEIVLKAPATGNRLVHAEHMVDFESLKAVPDQLVTYFFWAEDIGPDGQPRRTSGDMYFAEVRHFEEIFRQGEQPPSGSAENEEEGEQGNARSAEELAEVQKEIINATWKLIRRETRTKPSDKLAEDGKVLQDSQHSAIEKAAQLAERLQDASSKASLEQATRFMHDAEKQLTEVAEKTSIKALNPALAAEQAAYQALLKLRAREFQVVRNNSRRQRQSGRNSAGRQQQRQLQELELKSDENRYEEQRSARAQEERLTQREREQRETRQVVNRLRELAQRQSDVNQRLKELQSALEAAPTPQARQEIERQLKRLRDQQQQILRDTDELRERMEREENRNRMAEARQQIEQGREHVRQASEALEKGQIPEALTEGARAGRQLNDLRENLRKGAANRFTEEMTEMREQARQLGKDQEKISEQLEATDQSSQHSLRDSGERKQVRQGLEQQEKRLDQLLEQMRRTVPDAEETEPLLAKELYDTVRKATEQKIPDALKVAEQLVDLGVKEDAAKASRHAGQGIEQLKEGVERAARSVLGDDTAALRRAQGELDDLADQVDREIAEATGRDPTNRQRSSARQGAENQRDPNRQGRQGQEPQDQQGQQAREGQDGQPSQQGDQGRRGNQQRQREQGQQGQRGQQGQQGQPAERGEQQGQQGQRGEQQGQQGQQGQRGDRGEQQGQQGQQGQRGDRGEQQGQQGQQGQAGQRAEQPGQQGQAGGDQQGQQGQQGQAGGDRQGQQGQRGQQRLRGGNPANDRQGRQAGAARGGGDDLLGGPAGGPGGPIRGEGFRPWSDRMRDVEELLDDPELRAETARIRDRVRGEREEFKRHAKEPDWNRLQNLVSEPMNELRKRIDEELRRRESPDSLVPIDRDPVPPQYTEGVRRYYERLGSGR
jgi:hypothetical protein